jgi:Co/Zn/Cd efflux system component
LRVLSWKLRGPAGLPAGSTALRADSLDMLGGALVYGFSLYVVARNEAWKAGSALLKGAIMMVFGLLVLGHVGYRLLYPQAPAFETVGLIGLLALVANAACRALLWRHRTEDVNVRSVWLCSRNNIIANRSVLAAAGGLWLTGSQWPDLLVGLGIAALFLHSSFQVIRDAAHTYRAHQHSLPGSRRGVHHDLPVTPLSGVGGLSHLFYRTCGGIIGEAGKWRIRRRTPVPSTTGGRASAES